MAAILGAVACLDKDHATDVQGHGPVNMQPGDTGFRSRFSAFEFAADTTESPNPALIKPLITLPYDNSTAENLYRLSVTGYFTAPDNTVLDTFVKYHPGRLYVLTDEPDNPLQHPNDPAFAADSFAKNYCNFVNYIHDNIDATAKFTPGGFTREPSDPWVTTVANYITSSACHAPVAEWTFHLPELNQTSMDSFYVRVQRRLGWASSRGAPLVLGSFMLGGRDLYPSVHALADSVRRARDWLAEVSELYNLASARYTQYENRHSGLRTWLVENRDSLTPEGIAWAGYLSDNPLMLRDTLNVRFGVNFIRTYYSDAVTMHGQRYYSAIGTHVAPDGPGHADFEIPKGAQAFISEVGLGYSAGPVCPTTTPKIVSVLVDGESKWTGALSGTDTTPPTVAGLVRIPPGSQTLRLAFDPNGDWHCGRIVWGDPHYLTLVPNTLSPTMTGNTSLMTDEWGSWGISVSGAGNPRACEWSVDGALRQNGVCTFQTSFNTAGTHTVNVTLTDGYGHQGVTATQVNVSNCAPPLIQCRRSARPNVDLKRPPPDK